MIVIGLTGSIGMGKSTVASMLAREGIPVHEADDEVHDLLSPKGKAFRAVAAAFPVSMFPQIYGRKPKTGRYIKRPELGKIVFKDTKALRKLEKILHPLVRKAQNDFIRKHRNAGRAIVALDIPLLFETGGESLVHYTLVASAPYNVQRQRVLIRRGMSEKKFREILKKQMPDGEKCARADYVIRTGLGLAKSMKDVKAALRDIKKENNIK
jgi:dephospho-CoA kinase